MKTRMHPSIILENIISSIWIIIVAALYFLFNMFEQNGNETISEITELIDKVPFMGVLIGIGLFIIILILFMIFFFFKWYNTYIYFDEDSFNIESGKIFKKHTTIHLKDIASVNIKQNILEKVLNTSNMKIVLNTNDENNFKGKLIFKTNVAKKIKLQILKKETEEIEINSLIDFRLADIIKHIFFNTNVLTLLIVIAVYIPVIYFFIIDLNTKNLIVAIIITAVFVIGLVGAIVKPLLNYYNFKINREKDTIIISHGLLTTYRYELPIKKINAVIIKRTLQARICGYFLLEVVNAGMNENEQEKTILALYVKEDKLNTIFDKIIPEYQINIGLISQPKDAAFIYTLGKIFWFLLIIILLPFTNFWSLLLLPILIIVIVCQYKYKRLGVNNEFIIMGSGLLENEIVFVNLNKIELIAFEKGLFALSTNLWKVRMNIVGNKTNNSFVSGYYNEKMIKQIENVY